ncbi:MAG: efflux RND transporter periplasmic adaptor subunit [Proteobacteria bacterium]|nr:efflux RND transporter periplasmic adaptor subunit [Pseudomonadota bacterium]
MKQKLNIAGIGQAHLSGKTIIWLVVAVLAVFAAFLIIKAFIGDQAEDQEGDKPGTPVIVQKVSLYLFADIIEAIGTARANESVTLTAQISDTVQKVHFTDGAEVEAGTILVTLTNAEELANVSGALASYTEARQQFERTKPLVDKGALSQASMDAATRTLDEATARLNAARARAGDYVITAPFAGLLGLRQVSPGTLVSPGTEITTLDDITIIKLDFSIPERFISILRPGQEIAAKAAAYPDMEFRGIVKTINSRVNPVTRAVAVRAEIDNRDRYLRPGMLLTVDLVSNLKEALSVPEKSLIPVGGSQFVFVVSEDNKVERIEIEVGRRYGSRVEILSGLKAGDLIVISGLLRLGPGMAVRVLGEEAAPEFPEYLLSFRPSEQKEAGDDPF